MHMAIDPDSQPQRLAPGWVRDVMTGHESMAKEKERRELETRLPGITDIFEHLINGLPRAGTRQGVNPGEFPVSASVVRKTEDGKRIELVSIVRNRTNRLHDSTAHAEIEALREAESKIGAKHLKGFFLLSTCEPCVMCSGAAVNTELGGVIYGASQEEVKGTHALVDGEYKPWRTSPEGFNANTYLTESGLEVVGGFMAEDVLHALHRTHGTWAGHYSDPDA